MGIFLFILGIILFIGLILIHEWGHFKAARRNGVDVEEFGLFFPPRAKVLTIKNGTEYTLNWLPLGGFVKLKGEHDQDTEKGSFGAASTKAKTKIMLAGVVMNLISAFILFTIVALIGMPKLINNQFTVKSDTKIIQQEEIGVLVGQVVEGSPAAKAGIKKGDQIKSIAGEEINENNQVAEATEANKGKEVAVVVERKDQVVETTAKLNNESPYLGIGTGEARTQFEVRRSTWSAPVVAVGVMKDFTVATMKGIGTALRGLGSIGVNFITGNQEARKEAQAEAEGQVAGPVGIFQILYQISEQGIGLVLFIIAIISLTLAIMNALPIPALDGGRLFVMLLFRAMKKPLRPELEEKIHGTGFAVLMALFVLITIVDIRRF